MECLDALRAIRWNGLPQPPERFSVERLLYRDGSRQTAGRGGIVVQAPANVVAAGGMVVEGIPNVAVNKENVHGKVLGRHKGMCVGCYLSHCVV